MCPLLDLRDSVLLSSMTFSFVQRDWPLTLSAWYTPGQHPAGTSDSIPVLICHQSQNKWCNTPIPPRFPYSWALWSDIQPRLETEDDDSRLWKSHHGHWFKGQSKANPPSEQVIWSTLPRLAGSTFLFPPFIRLVKDAWANIELMLSGSDFLLGGWLGEWCVRSHQPE